MNLKKTLFSLAITVTLVPNTQAAAPDALLPLQERWAAVNYQPEGKTREQGFDALLKEADAVVKANPGSAEVLIWHGIIASSYAGAKGGLGALSLAQRSREDLEQALKLDKTALQGSAYTSLGALYYKVPGWPIAFGDDDKARTLLKSALEINPQGVDPNYFYADFLASEGDSREAMRYLEKAKRAPARPDRPLADAGRRQDIAALEERLKRTLGD
jgi:tetratricopeptide (TPR) repeat protein